MLTGRTPQALPPISLFQQWFQYLGFTIFTPDDGQTCWLSLPPAEAPPASSRPIRASVERHVLNGVERRLNDNG